MASRQMLFQMSRAQFVLCVQRIQEYRRAGVGLDAVPGIIRDQKYRRQLEAVVQALTKQPDLFLRPERVKSLIVWEIKNAEPRSNGTREIGEMELVFSR